MVAGYTMHFKGRDIGAEALRQQNEKLRRAFNFL